MSTEKTLNREDFRDASRGDLFVIKDSKFAEKSRFDGKFVIMPRGHLDLEDNTIWFDYADREYHLNVSRFRRATTKEFSNYYLRKDNGKTTI